MENRHKTKDASMRSMMDESPTPVGRLDPKPGASTFRRDLIDIGILAVVVYAFAVRVDLFEHMADWSRAHEDWQLDELLAAGMVLVVAAAVFAGRRWMEYRAELVRSNQAREDLRKAHDELELRVQERTRELSRANEQLQTEMVEREKAEELSRVSEARYRQFFQNSAAAILTVDNQGIIQSWNPTCEQISGFTAEDVIGKSATQFYLTDAEAKLARETISRVFRGEPTDRMEFDLVSKYGAVQKMTSVFYPLTDDRGTVVECAISGTDVTHLRNTEDALKKSQERLQLALRAADLGLWDYHFDTVTLDVDERWAEMHGYSVEELEPTLKTWWRLVHPEDQPGILEAFNAHMEGRAPMYESIQRERCKSGEWIWVQSRGKVVERDGRGRPTRFTGTTLNVTQSKRAEDALKQSEERYRMVVENARETITIVQDRKIKFANRSALDQHKYTEEEILSMNSLDLLVPEDREMVDKNYVRRLRGEETPDRYTVRFLDRDGSIIHCEISPVPVMWEGAPATLVLGTDVTERHRAEEALKESEQRLHLALEGADLGLWDWNLETGKTFFNQRSIEMLGYSPQDKDREISDWGKLVHPEDIPGIIEAFNAHLEGRVPFYESVHRLRRKSGEWMWTLARAKIVERKADGTPVRLTGINRDITEQKRAEEALIESEDLNQALVENAPMGIIYLDPNGIIEYVNPASSRMFGVPQGQTDPSLGRSVFCLPFLAEQPHLCDPLEALLQGEPQSDIECFTRSLITGRTLTLLAQATPRLDTDGTVKGAIVMYTDITGLKHVQGELEKSLEEKKVLLREMHHRVKNNLQVMSSLLSLQAGYVTDERHGQMFNDAESRIRAMSLVHEMLYHTDDFKTIHCNEYVEQMLAHLFRYYGTGTGTVGYNIAAEDIVIEPDKAVPFGLILNELVTNGLKHAFPDGRAGEILISVKLVDGEKVELVVRDDGIGLPPELDLDRTTSLGLRLVKVLAKQLEATIELRGETGTEYRITFNGHPIRERR